MNKPPLETPTLEHLAALADRADREPDWPTASWQTLCTAGVPAWAVPVALGGRGLDALTLLAGYEQLAGACLTTAFILSQREAAVRRLLTAPRPLQERLLPDLAAGRTFASVGLSQLTTSRQHQAPALTVTPDSAAGFVLDGVIPWVTGADQADVLVVGGPLPDGRQVLLALPRPWPGVTVESPQPLLALLGSRTAQVRCERVYLASDWLVAGPAEKVMATGRGGVGGVETSCLALGLAGAAVEYLRQEATQRLDLAEVVGRLEAARRTAWARLLELAVGSPLTEEVLALRVSCTRLVLQATQVALTAAKGTGFVAPHPVQRWVRQALFFLVWSCPRPAAEGVIATLLPDLPGAGERGA